MEAQQFAVGWFKPRRKILDTCVRNWLTFLCWTALAELFQQQTLKGQLTILDKLTHALRILPRCILRYQTNLWSFTNVQDFSLIFSLKLSATVYTLKHRKKRYKRCHWGCTFLKGKLLSILGANMYILGVMYILGAIKYILGVNCPF